MTRKLERWALSAAVAVVLGTCFTSPATAQDDSKRVKELEAKIELLEGRLKQLEDDQANAGRDDALETAINAMTGLDEDGNTFRAHWKTGLHFASGNKSFQLQIGGRIQNDWTFVSEDSDLHDSLKDEADGVEFRRARLFIAGTIYDNVYFKAQYDFAPGGSRPASFNDVYLGLKNVPVVGKIQVGHFKEPFGLEELTSSKYITFMERALPSVFTPSRNNGIMLTNTAADQYITWAIGVFRDADNWGDSSSVINDNEDSKYQITARVTGTPWFDEGGKRMVHLGAGFTWRNPDLDTVRFRQRPEAHLLKRWVDTSTISDVNDEIRFNFEGALVFDSFSLQTEFFFAEVDRSSMSDLSFWGYYVEASYWFTGEHRPYKRSNGTFSRPKPHENFMNGAGGAGAWQLAVRWSYLDLNDEEISGGQMETINVALNWWLNPNTRVTLNYVYADVEDGPYFGDAHIFMIRFQIDF